MGGEEGKQTGIPLPRAATRNVSCGLKFSTQFGFMDQVLRNYQALIRRHREQLLKRSWKLQATSTGDPRPDHGNCWLCESHLRHGSGVMALLLGKDGLQEPGVTSAFLHQRWEQAHLCEQSTALRPDPNPSCTAVPASVRPMAKGPRQTHMCCPKKDGLRMLHVVVQDGWHVVPAVLAPTAASSMCCQRVQLLLHWLLSEINFEWWKHDAPSSLSNRPRC